MGSKREFPVTIAVLAFDGCMTSAVTGILDALQIANLWAMGQGLAPLGAFAPSVFAQTERVLGSGGFVIPATPLDPTLCPDVVIVPPIMGGVRETLDANRPLVEWLRASQGELIASICAGAFFLGEAGLLSGRRATTNPAYAAMFRASYADVELAPEERLIDSGRILCAGSTTAFLDLGIYLIDRFAGHEVAVSTAKSLCVDKNRRSQLPYFLYVAPKDHGDSAILNLQTRLEEQYRTPLNASELARGSGLSLRSLNRRFQVATGLTPLEYLHRVRVETAKRLLETSDLSVEQITGSVGYQDPRSFSRLFRALAGVLPTEYRARFGARLD